MNSKISIREYRERDYDVLCSWWKAHKWSPVPRDALSDTGFVAIYDEVLICSGFVYLSNSSIAWLEWLLMNPKAPKECRSEALDKLIDHSLHFAKSAGSKSVFTSVAGTHIRLQNRIKDRGFLASDTNVSHFIRRF